MLKVLKNKLKNQKGFTLIELLAVIVILGILAAIAIPSIMGIINNSKKDAQVANAQQMVSAAKNAVASNDDSIGWTDSTATVNGASVTTSNGELTLNELITNGYLDNFTNPATNTNDYDKDTSKVSISKNSATNDITYKITLIGGDPAHTYINNIDSNSLKRSNVH